MKKIRFVIIALFTILITVVVLNTLHSEETDSSPGYGTISVTRRSIEQTVTATGIIKPKTGAEVKVGAQVSGIVKKLYVSIGSRVRKGQLLAELDPSGYKAKLDMVIAQKAIAESEKKFANMELIRSRNLLSREAITSQQNEIVEKEYELAQARLQQVLADLDYAALQLSYTKITSPIDGVVSSVSTQEGETVTASFASPTFVTIIDLNRLELWAYIDETDIGRIKDGQAAAFSVDTYPGEEFSGKVKTIYPKAEIQNNVVNYVTVINIETKDDKIIRPEMTTSVIITSGRKENIITVPKKFVKKEDGRTFVYVISSGKSKKRYITTGISDRKYYEAISGIKENERIVTGESKND